MKIAISTSGSNLDSQVESRFGRAKAFLIYNDESKETELVNNQQQLNAPQGAGVQAARLVANSGAKVLLSGHCGPKAYKVLEHAGVEVFTVNSMSVKEAISAYAKKKLHQLSRADVEEHWL